MRKPTRADCLDEHGNVDLECFNDACDRYADEARDEAIERQWEKEDTRSTCKEVYEELFNTYFIDYNRCFGTRDELNRKANAYAVANTPREWREQW